MFEQASLDTQGALKNPWAFTVSIAGQTVVITAAVLMSLIHRRASAFRSLHQNCSARCFESFSAATNRRSAPQREYDSSRIQNSRKRANQYRPGAARRSALALDWRYRQ
jgi:hypothetical protein